jgi:hypothetical protein
LSDWVADFDRTLERVLTHLELPPDANCLRFYESESRVRTVSPAQVRQPVNARGLGRWRAYAPELAPLIAEPERAGSLSCWAKLMNVSTRSVSTANLRLDQVCDRCRDKVGQ